MTFRDPEPEELREYAILADACLGLESARMYGLIEGGPEIDVQRCEEIVDLAHAAGHTWTTEEVEMGVVAIARMLEEHAAS